MQTTPIDGHSKTTPELFVRKMRLQHFLTFTLSALLAGCASSGVVTKVSPPIKTIRAHESASIETFSKVADSEPQRSLLHALITTGLQQSGKFKRVTGGKVTDAAPSDLSVQATIIQLSKVSDAARSAVGGLAGQASILVDVKLIDNKSDEEVGSFQVEGKSSGGFVWSGTTNQAIEIAAQQVVAFLTKSP